MKLLAGLLAFALSSAPIARAEEVPPDLVVYAYDSFSAQGGLGPEIVPLFEKKCGCRVSVLPSGDGGQILTRVQLDAEGKRRGAHIVLGIDQSLWGRAQAFTEPWGDWKPKGLDRVPARFHVATGFLAFDYGIFALMVDTTELSKRHLPVPHSLGLLLDPKFKRMVLLEDPRTSTPGLAFLLFTHEVLGEGTWNWWRAFRSQWLTLSPGWDQAYGLFLKGEAPLVWSYVTSQAYHAEHGEKSRYKAFLFKEGNPIQIEGAALVKGALQSEREKKLARQFLEFLLSPDVQSRIPRKNWMFPVVKGVKLPESFRDLPEVPKTIDVRPDEAQVKKILSDWGTAIR